MSPCVSGVVPPTDSFSRRRRARDTLDVGRSTTSAVRFLKITTATRSRRTYASWSSDRIAPLVAAIRCSASIEADASTTKTIRLPTLRSRTFWRRSSRSSLSRSPGRRPRSFCIGAAARTVASIARSLTLAFGSARTYRPRRSGVWLADRLPPCLRKRRWRGRSMRRRLKVSVASGEDSCALDPPLVIPWSLPADCCPPSDALALSSAVACAGASLSDAWGSPAWLSAACDPSWSSPRSGELLSSWSRVTGAGVDVLDGWDRLRQRPRQVVVCGSELIGELVVAALEGRVALGDQHPLVGVADALDVDTQSEAVEQLRAKLTLLGVHRADQDETRGMRERHPLPLDHVHAHRSGVQQHIHDVVVEQVDLVDIEDVPVRLSEDAWFETPRPRAQGRFDVDGAHDAVLGRVDWQLDHAHPAPAGGQHAGRLEAAPAFGAQRLADVGIAAEVAALDHQVLGQKPGQRPDGGRLASALLAPDEHAADRRHDGIEDEGQLHRVLAHDRRERKNVTVERDAHVSDAHVSKDRWAQTPSLRSAAGPSPNPVPAAAHRWSCGCDPARRHRARGPARPPSSIRPCAQESRTEAPPVRRTRPCWAPPVSASRPRASGF